MLRRVLLIVAGVVVGLVVVALIAVFVVTNTDWGHERVRRYAQKAVQGGAKYGIVRLGPISGNLLDGFTITGVSITDSTGAPFLTADTATINYGLRTLLQKKLYFHDVRLVHPVIVLNRPPGGLWNYQRIFAMDTTPSPKDTTRGFGSWMAFDNVTLVKGDITVRTPWKPKEGLTVAQRDSAVRVALSDSSRMDIVRVPGGFQMVAKFRDVDGVFPYIRLRDPDNPVQRFEVKHVDMVAEPFRPPAADIRNVAGVFEMTTDSIWWKNVTAQFPKSSTTLTGEYTIASGNMRLEAKADSAVGADLQWLYPATPEEMVAKADIAMRVSGDTTDFTARDADVRIDSAHVSGSVGLTMGDTMRFHGTDLRFASLDTKLIERMAPQMKIPRQGQGVLDGRAQLDGSMSLMRVNTDVTFTSRRAGRSRVMAAGDVGYARDGVRARGLRVQLAPLKMDLVKIGAPTLPVGGEITGYATLDGNQSRMLFGKTDLTHHDVTGPTRFTGHGEIRRSRNMWMDIDADFRPLSLATVGKFAPAAELYGTAQGQVHVTGTMNDLALSGDLTLPDSGEIAARGRVDVESKDMGYALDVNTKVFNASRMSKKAPVTTLSGTMSARGRGTDPATMHADVRAEFLASRVDTFPAIDTARVKVTVADGVVRADTIAIRAPNTRADASGMFGLVDGKSGELRYAVAVDSLATLRRFMPASDTGTVPPRPAINAEKIAKARDDSARAEARLAVQRAAVGGPPPPKLKVDTLRPIPRDSLAGSLKASGTLTGNAKAFDATGVATADGVIAQGNSVRHARAQYRLVGMMTPTAKASVDLRTDSLLAGGFALDSLDVKGEYQKPGATVNVSVYKATGEHYAANGQFVIHPDHNELHLQDLALQFDSTVWKSTGPSTIQWGKPGLQVARLELRDGKTGRVFIDGAVPSDEGAGGLDVSIDNFQIADIASLLQSDLVIRGLFSTDARIEGTLQQPQVRSVLSFDEGKYKNQEIPDVHANFRYANSVLTLARADMTQQGGPSLVRASGTIPVYLGTSPDVPRFPDRPMSVDATIDSLPIDLAPKFTDAVSDVRGHAYGNVQVRGRMQKPDVHGKLALERGQAHLNAAGITLGDMLASIRLNGDSVVIDSLVGQSGGRIAVRGGVNIATPTDPVFDMNLRADNALVLDNDQGRVRIDAGLSMKGPMDATYVSGRVNVLNGVLYPPEPDGKHVVSTGDPAVFVAVDTSVTSTRELLPAQSPMMANMRADVDVHISRDTWVRSKDANVEIYTPAETGDLTIHVDERKQALLLEGEVATDRGEYSFLSKRFQIQRGSATFIGSPDLNPTLQISAGYEVRVPSRPALNIKITIGGTMRNPSLTLESDATPPISQSDLLSYLAFGQSTSSLLQLGGSSISGGGGGTNNFAGAGAAFLGQRLSAVAIGTLTQEVQGQATRQFGLDFFNITPADIYSELTGGGGIGGFFRQTQLEAGKYIDRQTFTALQLSGSVPGAQVQRRIGKGYRVETSFGPRYAPRAPSLEDIAPARFGVFGLFLIREWRY